ncbi:hypothetical protein HanRHA438_Chr16g0764031 [Helianthus annuus]|nr:hypothetical protein HanIR_Chr16g0817321 [Helianthus annuus]KAJ0645049.1 hypothetical protein HanOQP8_Chr16g0619491 [Helianthus annuus]KAJ0836181.1 hypothetical protein HanRHA438_Chr16g0764031 [Helianthus annuus]
MPLVSIESGYSSMLMESICNIPELISSVAELTKAAYKSGRKDGYGEGKSFVVDGRQDKGFDLHMKDCATEYKARQVDFDNPEFGIITNVLQLAHHGNVVDSLKELIEHSREGGIGPSGV